jgi:hypothetical protein
LKGRSVCTRLCVSAGTTLVFSMSGAVNHTELSSESDERYVRTLAWPNNSGPANPGHPIDLLYQAGSLRSLSLTRRSLYVFVGRFGAAGNVARKLFCVDLQSRKVTMTRLGGAVPAGCDLLTVLHYDEGGRRRPLVVYQMRGTNNPAISALITADGQSADVGDFLCRRVLQFEYDTLLVGVAGAPPAPCRVYLSARDGALRAQMFPAGDPLIFVDRLRFAELASVRDYVRPHVALGTKPEDDPLDSLPPGTRRMVDGPARTTARNTYQRYLRDSCVHMHCAGSLFWIDSSCIRMMDNARPPTIEWSPPLSVFFAPRARAAVRTLLCLRERSVELGQQPMHLFHMLLRWIVVALTTNVE